MEFYSSLGQFPFLSGMCELRLGGENRLVPSSLGKDHHVPLVVTCSQPSQFREDLPLAPRIPGSPCTRVQLPPLSLASIFLPLLPSPQRGARQLLLRLSLHLCSRRRPKMAISSGHSLAPVFSRETCVIGAGARPDPLCVFLLHLFSCILICLCSPGSEEKMSPLLPLT